MKYLSSFNRLFFYLFLNIILNCILQKETFWLYDYLKIYGITQQLWLELISLKYCFKKTPIYTHPYSIYLHRIPNAFCFIKNKMKNCSKCFIPSFFFNFPSSILHSASFLIYFQNVLPSRKSASHSPPLPAAELTNFTNKVFGVNFFGAAFWGQSCSLSRYEIIY